MEGECTDKNMFVEISKYDFIEMFIYSIRVKGTRSWKVSNKYILVVMWDKYVTLYVRFTLLYTFILDNQ